MLSGLLIGMLVSLAQSPARGSRDHPPIIITLPGATLTGTLLQMDTTTVTFLGHDGRRTLPLNAVLKIEAKRRDSSLDGAVIGGVVALFLSVLANATYAAESKGAIIRPMTLLGGVIGWRYDATHQSIVTIYERPPAQSPRAPAGVSFTIRF